MTKRYVIIEFSLDSELSRATLKKLLRDNWNLHKGGDDTLDGPDNKIHDVKYGRFYVDICDAG